MTAVAVVALCISAVGAASAMALPEFTTVPNSFTGTSGTSTLKAGNVVITCTSDATSNGKVTSATEVTGTVIFKGCTGKTGTGEPCAVRSPGAVSGEIKTAELLGKLGYISKTAKTVGLKLAPKTGTNFTEIEAVSPATCVVKTAVTKSIIGAVTPVNTKTTKGALTFTETSEKQTLRKFEGEEVASELQAFGTAARLTGTEEVTFEKEGEVKA